MKSYTILLFSLLVVTASPLVAVESSTAPALIAMEKLLHVSGSHLIVPVANYPKNDKVVLLGIYDGAMVVQAFTVALPQNSDAFWLSAYPLERFGLEGRQIRIAPVDGGRAPESCRASFDQIRIGSVEDALSSTDYAQPYRNQFHVSSRRGWNNDPNGMVFHDGKYHLYSQHNPFGIYWGNMHWGHFESSDLVHWQEKPIALYQKTMKDMAFSGGGFVDFNDSAGVGANTQFAAFTSTGRGGECLAYSKDGGLTFTELPESPVVKHRGRDPKVFWYQPEKKWVMVVYDESPCAETEAIVQMVGPKERVSAHLAFWESKNLRRWRQTGAFTDADRLAVFECPEMFELQVAGKPGETRWILFAAQNRYFVGHFDGKTFHKESGPHGSGHGAFYAAQTFSDVPDNRRIQIGWVRTETYLNQFPDQIVNQAFSLPHELTLRETDDGLRVFFSPVKETESLRGEILADEKNLTPAQANELIQKCRGELSEVLLEFSDAGPHPLRVNGIDARFHGQKARVFTDRTFNEIYSDDGKTYELRNRLPRDWDSTETQFGANEGTIRSLKIFRLKSIWPEPLTRQ